MRGINIEQIKKRRFKNVQNLEVLQRLENARQGFFKETSTLNCSHFSEELLVSNILKPDLWMFVRVLSDPSFFPP